LNQLAEQMGKPVSNLTDEALRALSVHESKGNVREIRHCLEQAVVLGDELLLTKDALRLVDERPHARQIFPDSAGDSETDELRTVWIDAQLDRLYVRSELEGHADMGHGAQHRFLSEARLVGRDNFLNRLVRGGIIRMDKAHDVRGLANHFT
jgi:DNA-binding NtrC family response regulator